MGRLVETLWFLLFRTVFILTDWTRSLLHSHWSSSYWSEAVGGKLYSFFGETSGWMVNGQWKTLKQD